MAKQRLVVLTGAGISAESGLQTFRDGDGLWENHRIEDVATPEAFERNPQLVLDFYNFRRHAVLKAQPNSAHIDLVKLEEKFDVQIITQNIDDLHERAGSANVLHLHGEITKCKTTSPYTKYYPYDNDLKVGDKGSDGYQMRPHIVWFGESVPMMDKAMSFVSTADLFLLIGTSLLVYPAAGLINYLPLSIPIFVVDKKLPQLPNLPNLKVIEMPATAGMKEVLAHLL